MTKLAPLFALFSLLTLGACAHGPDGSPSATAALPALPNLIQLPTGPQAQANPCGEACAYGCIYGCATCAGGLQQVSAAPIPVDVPEPALPAPGPTVALGY